MISTYLKANIRITSFTRRQNKEKDLKQDKNVIKKSEKYNNKNYKHEQLNLKKKKSNNKI